MVDSRLSTLLFFLVVIVHNDGSKNGPPIRLQSGWTEAIRAGRCERPQALCRYFAIAAVIDQLLPCCTIP